MTLCTRVFVFQSLLNSPPYRLSARMSDDEGGGPPPDEEPTLDEKGFHIIRTGGKLQNQANPLQLKMERERKEREEKAKKDAKKAALNNRLAAFGGNKQTEGESASPPRAGRLGGRLGAARELPACAAPLPCRTARRALVLRTPSRLC